MGLAGSLCRRSAVEAAAATVGPTAAESAPARPVPRVRSMAAASSSATRICVEEKRQRGLRPNAPRYHDTPLLTVGKEVYIQRGESCRQALIECVNEADQTVDISYEDGNEEEAIVPFAAVRPLEVLPEEPGLALEAVDRGAVGLDLDPVVAPTSTQERRQLGIRPNAPAYADTPLLSVGKQVRVMKREICRRATIECVNDDEGTIDVVYLPPEETWPISSAGGKEEVEEEDTVPADAARPLEDFEVRKESEWQLAFQEDFYGSVASVKEGANELFKLKDYDAAVSYYSVAIGKLRILRPPDLGRVMLIQSGTFVLGTVKSLDSNLQKVAVAVDRESSGGTLPPTLSLPARTLIAVHDLQLTLQSSLYMNRARSLAQLGRNQEAAQDLSVVIALWSTSSGSEERREQLLKAHCLRAKTRLSRMRVGPAREDVKSAWSLGPPDTTVKLLRQLERDIDLAEKEKIRSNKRIAKEMAKFTDEAMSQMSTAQMTSLGTRS